MSKDSQIGAIAIRQEQAPEVAFKTDDRGALRPGSLDEMMRFAGLLADSGMVPKDYLGKPGNVLVAIQMGAEVGLAPMAAIQNIAVINGRPSVWGDAALAICRTHREWGGIEEEIGELECTCTVTRIERTPAGPVKSVVRRTFSMEDAKRAGLASKDGPWKQYPRRMMQMRARAFALRDAFTDALKGLASAEEVTDYAVETTGQDVTAKSQAALPKTGAESVLDKLRTKKAERAEEPATVAAQAQAQDVDTSAAFSWCEAFSMAETLDDWNAIKRDLDGAWPNINKPSRAAITKAATEAKDRLAKAAQGQG